MRNAIAIGLCLALGAAPALAGPLAEALDRLTPRDNPSPGLHSDALAGDAARHRLESDGYAGVSTLLRGRDRRLQGKAVKDGRVMDIEIDRHGNVTAR